MVPTPPTKEPKVKALNPLPQSGRALQRAPVVLSGGLATGLSSGNAASSQKWVERPVEKLSLSTAHYEEEEDPEMACYLWDRRSQRPKNDHVRAAPAPQRAAPPPQLGGPRPGGGAPAGAGSGGGRALPPPPKYRQQALLGKVMEMGFDEPSAKRALHT